MRKIISLILLLFLQGSLVHMDHPTYLPIVTTKCAGALVVDLDPVPKWQTLELTVDHTGYGNPFMDYTLEVQYHAPDGSVHKRPGFYAGNDQFKARHAPDRVGTHTYCAVLKHGGSVIRKQTGSFLVTPIPQNAQGFYRYGRLVYVGDRYLKHVDGPYFLKGGTNSPENWLAYTGFPNTQDQNGSFLHSYTPHGGIYGAIDYLADQGVNAIYFLPMNLGGDGQDTYPFVHPDDPTIYDVTKLDAWYDWFEYVQQRGIQIQLVLGEAEPANVLFFDNGTLGPTRKLYYRELVARFGHLPAIKWNIAEENQYNPTVTTQFALYLDGLDTYSKVITHHTINNDTQAYQALIDGGVTWINSTSLQVTPDNVVNSVNRWRNSTDWVIDVDEVFSATGLTCCNATELRQQVLYPVYMRGGNIEWYVGQRDQTLENFAEYEDMWFYMYLARYFIQGTPNWWTFQPLDGILNGSGYVLGGGDWYLVYITNNATIDLPYATYQIEEINPANGMITLDTRTGNMLYLDARGTDRLYRIHKQ